MPGTKPVKLGQPGSITGPYFRIKDLQQINLCYSLNERLNNSLLHLTSAHRNIMRVPIGELTFKIKPDEVFVPGNRAGILFAVHSPFEAENPFETGVFMKPGRTYMIYVTTNYVNKRRAVCSLDEYKNISAGMKKDETILEKSPYDTDCVNHTESWEKNGRSGPRSELMCKHNCAAEMSLLCYGCIMPTFLYPRKEKYCELERAVFSNKNCPDDTSELEEYCYKTCKKDCRQTKFHITVQERFKGYYDTKGNMNEDITNLIKVEVYLDSDEVVVHKYSPKYTNIEVFSVIGGFIGIWLGMSLLDIYDIFEGIFRLSRFSFKKKREFKEISLATQ